MVSVAKLKKAQDATTAMRPYAEKLTESLQNLSSTLDEDVGGEFTTQREVRNEMNWFTINLKMQPLNL
jgi:F-type H+-transporting ATPase subunit gamma